MAHTQQFDKELFKKNVVSNVKTLYRRTLEEATPQQIFQAVCYAAKDIIVAGLTAAIINPSIAP